MAALQRAMGQLRRRGPKGEANGQRCGRCVSSAELATLGGRWD